ncbi:MAG TPA: hypothetical protein VH593_25850, partial [Ktedonobacteraceae bacterium]
GRSGCQAQPRLYFLHESSFVHTIYFLGRVPALILGTPFQKMCPKHNTHAAPLAMILLSIALSDG